MPRAADPKRIGRRFLYCGWRLYHPFGSRWLPRLFNLPCVFSEFEVACRRQSEIAVVFVGEVAHDVTLRVASRPVRADDKAPERRPVRKRLRGSLFQDWRLIALGSAADPPRVRG